MIRKITNTLTCSKRFVAELVLGITVLITIIGSLATATTALIQEVHTAQHVDQLAKIISLALTTQEIIDKKLEVKVNACEETLKHIGNKIVTLKVHHYKWICVTPLEVNQSAITWDKIQHRILGIWNNSNLSLDLEVTSADL